MSEIEKFLEPISGENRVGKNLKNSLYDKIREARRQEDAGPRGVWEQREVKAADFKQVIKLSEEALLKTTKDLQIAVWLTDAWIREYELPGLTSGLQLLHGFVDRFWDDIYPELDEGDPWRRFPLLDWVGSYFDPAKGSSPIFALRSVALTQEGHSWFDYQESRSVGYESEATGSETRKARQTKIEEGKLAPEIFDKAFEDTPKQFYKDLERDCVAAREALEKLDELCREKFGAESPSYSPMKDALAQVENVVHILLSKKLQKEPDLPEPVAATKSETQASDKAEPNPNGAVAAYSSGGAAIDLSQLKGGAITSAEQAVLHVVAAAEFMRRQAPASPVSYLLLRALRWGEVRGSTDVASADLPAPPSEARVTLKSSAAGKNWKRVLETAETAMGSAIGRGWLDLQRYSIRACDELGYTAAAKALRSELKAFLADFPELPSATLGDDTGTANPETLAWLRAEGFIS